MYVAFNLHLKQLNIGFFIEHEEEIYMLQPKGYEEHSL